MFNIDIQSGLIISCIKIFLILFGCTLTFIAFFSVGHVILNFFLKRISLNKITGLVVKVTFGSIIFSLFFTLCGVFGFDLSYISLITIPLATLLLDKKTLINNFSIFKKLLIIHYRGSKKILIKLVQVLLVILFFRAFLPVTDWDSAVYHIPAIQKILQDGKIGAFINEDMFNLPLTYQILFTPFIALNIYEATQLISFILLLLTIIALYEITKILNLKKLFALSLVILLANPLFLNVITARVEIFIAFLTTLNLLLFLNLNKKPECDLLSAGIAISLFTTAIKPTGIPIGFIFILLYLYVWLKKLNLIEPNWKQIVIIQLCVMPSLIWYGKNLVYFGSPFYPYFQDEIYSQVNEEKVPLYKTAKELLHNCNNPELKGNKIISKWTQDIYNAPPTQNTYSFDLYDFVFNQSVYVDKWNDKYFPLLLLSIIPFWIKNKKIWITAGVSITLLLIFLTNSSRIRYGIPIIPLLSLLTAFNIFFILKKLRSQIANKVYLSIIAICVYFITHSQIKIIFEKDPVLQVAYLSGNISLRDYLEKTSVRSVSPTKVFNYLDTHYNKKSTVMMIGNAHTLYLQRPYIADYDGASRQMIPWLRLIVQNNNFHQKMKEELDRRNVGYIVVNYDYLLATIKRYRMLEENNIWVKELDRSDPELMARTLVNLGAFLNTYTKQIFYDYSRKTALYKVLPRTKQKDFIPQRNKNKKTCDFARAISYGSSNK